MEKRMPAYVIPQLDPPALPVRGTDKLFPVHRIYCVGRN
jgi:fumarylpyruvate hydrolase